MKQVSVFRSPQRGWLQGFYPNQDGGLIAVFSEELGVQFGFSHIAALTTGTEIYDALCAVDDVMRLDVEVSPEHLYQGCKIEVDFLSKYGLDFDAETLLAHREPAGSC